MTRRRKQPPNLSKAEMFRSPFSGRKKYPDIETTADAKAAADAEPKPPELSPADAKRLRAMVRRYGRDLVAEAARTIPAPGPGRPPNFGSPLHKSNVAWWIDSYAEEFRLAGSRTPIKDAEHALYEIAVNDEEQRQPGHFQRWQKLIKKKRLLGRPIVQAEREVAERFNALAKRKS
jgi:hypothetical protein